MANYSKAKNIISILISSIVGLIFILSGITKLYPIEYFETIIIERSGFGTEFAEWAARLLIAAEWALGLLLILRWRMKKFTIPLSITFLIGFCIILIMQIFSENPGDNCGCFGNVYVMSPIQAIIKNIIIALFILSYYFISEKIKTHSIKWLIPIFIISVSLPFVFRPGEIIYPNKIFLDEPKEINLSLLYTDSINRPPNIDLQKGKKIIAFYSLKCKHCKLAAYKMAILYHQNPELPFYMVLNGDSTELNSFFNDTQSEIIPHSLFIGGDNFISMSGPSLPAIYLVNNSYVEGKFTYRNISQKNILEWLETSTNK